MKKINNSDGFSVLEFILVVTILSIIGVAGYFVYHSSHKNAPQSSTTYDFKKLGISMDILPGWNVKEGADTPDVNEYAWKIQKADADGYIFIDSYINTAGPRAVTCDAKSTFFPVTVLDYAKTRNSNLLFISWKDNYANFGYTNLTSPTEKFFFTSKNLSSKIEDQNAKTGNYFVCGDETAGTGSSLDLNSEYINDNPNRLNTIKAFDNTDRPLPFRSGAYSEIRDMLTSVR